MVVLIDDVLLIIFKKLNLNERAPVRLVNKKFRDLIDSIPITKLIIYEKERPPITYKLEYLNESFNQNETASVSDLQKFFNSKLLIRQMKRIKILKIKYS